MKFYILLALLALFGLALAAPQLPTNPQAGQQQLTKGVGGIVGGGIQIGQPGGPQQLTTGIMDTVFGGIALGWCLMDFLDILYKFCNIHIYRFLEELLVGAFILKTQN